MNRRNFLKNCGITLGALAMPGCQSNAASDRKKLPNIIYIMLDELGYFELSCMGNDKLATPNIDKMAKEGMRFTQMLAGGSVCAPTRSVLMTGKHLGHTTVRGNGGGMALTAEDITIAQMLKQKNYATGGFGKWGLGDRGTTGVPENHGFDTFYGYYHQVHAHSYYSRYLVRNSEKEYLKGNTGDLYEGETFAQDRIFEEAIKFIRANKDKPFFCYCPWTPPHGLWGFPKDDPAWELYKDKDWTAGQRKPTDAKIYAAMVSMIDRQVGEIFDLLKQLKLDDNTIVFFCGDNGGQPYFNNGDPSKPRAKQAPFPHGFFGPNLNPATKERFRGGKGNFYEGGLRIPFIVRWPEKIKADSVSDHLGYFPDVMATLADITDTKTPTNTDGVSFRPTLLDDGQRQKQHEYLYWEMGSQIAVRMDDYKMVKPGKNRDFELYDLSEDVQELNNIAKSKPAILNKMKSFAEKAHTKNIVGTYLPGKKELGFQGQDKD